MVDRIQNAKVRSTTLGYEDHGILTAFVDLDYGGSGQGFGGYALDTKPNQGEHNRAPHIACGSWVGGILWALGVDSWEKVVGAHARAAMGQWRVEGIGHIIEDRWVKPSDSGLATGTYKELFG